ncbi:MAG TPA: tetratricopeptide repeat protein [Gammaproteobacteria bacterium]|nr:tetratricopeptide repeat protein [Gammaproteobacteria bacterium]
MVGMLHFDWMPAYAGMTGKRMCGLLLPAWISSIVSIVLLLAACGSAPPPQPAVVTATRDAMSLGMQAYADNRYLEARNYFERALVQYRSVDDRGGQLDALVDLADSALGQGEPAAARSYLGAADKLLATSSDSTQASHVALLHAYADLQAGDNQQAVARLDALLDNTATPEPIRQAALLARTQCAFNLHATDTHAWLAKLEATTGIHAELASEARYLRLKALAARQANDNAQASELYRQALDRYRSQYNRPGIAATLEEWADLSVSQQDWPAARDRLGRALPIRLWLYDRNHAEKDLRVLSRVDAALGNETASKQDLKLADYLGNGGDPAQLTALGQTRPE